MSQKTLGVLEVQAIDGDLQCAKNPDPSKMAILRTYTPLLYRFKPFHWRAKGQHTTIAGLFIHICFGMLLQKMHQQRVGMAQLF